MIEAVRHARRIRREIGLARSLDDCELFAYAKELQVPYDLLKQTAKMGRLPVVDFAAGGIGGSILLISLGHERLLGAEKHRSLEVQEACQSEILVMTL